MRLQSLLLAIFLLFLSLTISSYTDLNEDFQRKGIEKLELGNYNGAIIDFSKAIEIDPNDAVTYDYRGVAKAKRGDFSGSIIDYNKSLELDPNQIETLLNKPKKNMDLLKNKKLIKPLWS